MGLHYGRTIPDTETLTFGNTGIKIDAVVLYADLSNSTNLVDYLSAENAASIYKSYLWCAGKIIKAENGNITAYDGDRIMAVYLGDGKESQAVRTAKKISYAVDNIINPKFSHHYDMTTKLSNALLGIGLLAPKISHTVGIDKSELFVVKSGFRGADDLVWIGKAANHAAKIGDLPGLGTIRISKEVYDRMSLPHGSNALGGLGGLGGLNMLSWHRYVWTEKGRTIYHTYDTEPISPASSTTTGFGGGLLSGL